MQCNSKKMPLDAKFTIISWLPLKTRTLTDEMQHGHFKFRVMKTVLRFQIIYNHPNKRSQFPSGDHLSCPITADITSLFPVEVPHLLRCLPPSPPPLVFAHSYRLTFTEALHSLLSRREMVKLFSAQRGLSSHSLSNYRLCLSFSRLRLQFAASFCSHRRSVAFSLQTNFIRSSSQCKMALGAAAEAHIDHCGLNFPLIQVTGRGTMMARR